MLPTIERLPATGNSGDTETTVSLGEARLPVLGTLPSELRGALLQAHPHPGRWARRHSGAAPLAVSGVRFRHGEASWYQVGPDVRRPCPFGPVADLGEPVRLAGLPATAPDGSQVTEAWPVRDPELPVWHTVVTYADRRYAEHLVVKDGGAVLRSQRIPLDHAPLMHAVAVTERHLVVLDLPVTYRRAAAMVGERSPYAWQSGRPARIGLLPRLPERDATPRWFEIDPGYTFRTVNAFDSVTDDGDHVVVDLMWHGADAGIALDAPGPAPVVRWTLDLATGQARARTLTEAVRVAVTDPGIAGRRNRFLFSANDETIGRYDLETGRSTVRRLGAGQRAGQPVLVNNAAGQDRVEGAGYLMVFVENVAHRRATVLVLDAADVAGDPVAEIPLPAGVAVSPRATWTQPTTK